MNKNIIKYTKSAVGIGIGISIGQYLLMPDPPFDVYRPVVVGILTALIMFTFDYKKSKKV